MFLSAQYVTILYAAGFSITSLYSGVSFQRELYYFTHHHIFGYLRS